ncbi:molecular chaperone HtpG [bacterium]|nr:molecular chaperone HtpG [bacterium]
MSNKQKESSPKKTFKFKAEVAKVLEIVVNSLYTDREIFVRELISNATDAMEKRRHHDLVSGRDPGKETPMEISIKLDEENKTLTITDTGIGMTKSELVENLGKIAHSGAADFLEKAVKSDHKDFSLIGQFGVGFYSAFIVADEVTVKTRSVEDGEQGWIWISKGVSDYSIESADGILPGTSIELKLKEDASEFAGTFIIKNIIRKYSSFVPFPIKVNDETVNTIQAIWTRTQSEVKDDDYKEFYKFTAPSNQDPLGWIHFNADAPLAIKSLLFIPAENPEKLGLGRSDTNVNLYCRKILIQRNVKDLLPQWLRFVTGVVDSEDIPLNISRESMQDSALVRKINRVLTKRILKYFKKTADKNPDLYQKIWNTFGVYIKEGIISEFTDRDALADLLRFETSMTDPGQMASLAEYIDRMPESQKEIYYIAGITREAIESGPYIEVFKKNGIEVIYNYDPVDDFVMHHLAEYKEKKTVSADSESIDLPEIPSDKVSDCDEDETKKPPDEIKALTDWIRSKLQDKIADVKPSKRLVSSPMILVNPDGAFTGAMQKLMEVANKEFNLDSKRNLQYNPDHVIIKKLDDLRGKDEAKALLVLEQLFDHSALDAGLSVETRSLIDRVNRLIEDMLA